MHLSLFFFDEVLVSHGIVVMKQSILNI